MEGIGFFVFKRAVGGAVFEAVGEAGLVGTKRLAFENIEKFDALQFRWRGFLDDFDDLLVCHAASGDERDVARGGGERRDVLGTDNLEDVAEKRVSAEFRDDEWGGDTPFAACCGRHPADHADFGSGDDDPSGEAGFEAIEVGGFEAQLRGVPVVEAADFDRAVERCVDHVLDVMLMEQVQAATGSAAGGPSA